LTTPSGSDVSVDFTKYPVFTIEAVKDDPCAFSQFDRLGM
jgi:hypothetical protein